MTDFKPTYLYIKQHSKTGKLYFGKTNRINKNVDDYKGSGKHWIKHYNYHGSEYIETLWYCLFYDKEECNKFALMFSEQQNIVESNVWANLIIETGLNAGGISGYKHSEETKAKISISSKGRPKSEAHRQALKDRVLPPQSEETKKKRAMAMTGKTWKVPAEGRKNMSEAAKRRIRKPMSEETKRKIGAANKIKLTGIKRSEEFKRKISEKLTGRIHSEESKAKMSKSMIGNNKGFRKTKDTNS